MLDLSCGGGHLGFLVNTKIRNFVRDYLMNIHLQFG